MKPFVKAAQLTDRFRFLFAAFMCSVAANEYDIEENKANLYEATANASAVCKQSQLITVSAVNIEIGDNAALTAGYSLSSEDIKDLSEIVEYGHAMLCGRAVKRNERGVHLLKLASIAVVYLGDCFYTVSGVSEDQLFSKAANEHNYNALAKVVVCLPSAEGVSRDVAKGFECIRVASAEGDWFALNLLADLTRHGYGTAANGSEALVLYQRIVSGGNSDANLQLGEMYQNGEGTVVNIPKAVHHFEIYDKDEGHCNLALIYQNEHGFVDENRAVYHYRIAAELGNVHARERVGEYFVKVTGPRKLSYTKNELESLSFLRNTSIHFQAPQNTLVLREFSRCKLENNSHRNQQSNAQFPLFGISKIRDTGLRRKHTHLPSR